jgi:hypothetical protein
MSFNPDKTEIMICSNMDLSNNLNLNFSFNGELISNTSSHKHLGVTLSHDAKWSEHVENIAKTISKHLGVLEVVFCDAYYVMVPSQFRNIKNQSL